jgi:predicted nucleic acid-binding protein
MRIKPLLTVSAVSLISLGVGGILGYKIAERNLALRFEERLHHEVAASTAYYEHMNLREKKFDTPEEAAAALIKPETLLSEVAERERIAYHKIVQNYESEDEVKDPEDAMALEIMFPTPDPDVLLRNNVFSNKPHVVTQEEFIENDSNWNQSTLTWYVIDKVLADERDQVIEDVEGTIGSENLALFGQGSSDDNIVHIRNPHLQLEFEVLRHEGSYSRVVLGLDEDPPQRPSGRS